MLNEQPNQRLKDFWLRLVETFVMVWVHIKNIRISGFWKAVRWTYEDTVWIWTCDLDAYWCCHGLRDQGGCGCHGLTNRDLMEQRKG